MGFVLNRFLCHFKCRGELMEKLVIKTVNEKLVETLALEGEEWINSSENIESLGEDGIEEAFAFISKTEDDDLYF